MPALPLVPLATRVDFLQQIGEDTHALNRIFFATASGYDAADAILFSNAIAAEWTTHIRPLLTAENVLQSIKVLDLSANPSTETIVNYGLAGTSGGTSLPAEVCAVIRNQIARRYRGGKPKTFLSGIAESELSDPQTWAPGFVTSLENNWAAFVNGIVATGPPGVGATEQLSISYYELFDVVVNPITHRARNVPRVRAVPFKDPVISYSVDVNVGSQRRRSLLH